MALYSVLKKIDSIDASEYARENCYPYIWHANEEVCGYLIDVRANIGGNSSNADAVAAMFIGNEFLSCAGETQIYEPTHLLPFRG